MKSMKSKKQIPLLDDMKSYETRKQWLALPMMWFGISREEAYKIIDEEMARFLKEQGKIN